MFLYWTIKRITITRLGQRRVCVEAGEPQNAPFSTPMYCDKKIMDIIYHIGYITSHIYQILYTHTLKHTHILWRKHTVGQGARQCREGKVAL